ncbi:MAG: rhomboid family intramembrane serine protease [Methanomassiliicoccales archaeon]|nr:rhomboid family intramembrane serine protease [Methanomassiliicoccales archaeon]
MDIFSILAIAVIVGSLIFGFWKKVDLVPVLIMANLLVFMLTIISPWSGAYQVQFDLGFRPVYLQTGENIYTIFTQMFVHGDIWHILFNMLFLYLIGVQLEDRIGKIRFATVYFIAGIVGVVAESLLNWGSFVLIIGASGAISGAMGAMLLLYPREKIPFFLGPIFLPNIPVWAGVGSWFAIQIFLFYGDSMGGVAYMAHIAGFMSGVVIALLLMYQKDSEKEVVLSVDELDFLATTPELKDALQKVRGEENEDIQRVWLEYFAENAKCPRCGSRLRLEGSKIRCNCGFQAGTGWRRTKL